MLSESKIKELKRFAVEIRMETMKAIGNFGAGHVGGAMSMVEVLYMEKL